eukprot:TRINITY_DN6447_c0_g1_i6.p1 TRINITY_DN6447_c0_g1~~TRINITY_DN6447_c0_g1_i6.p1  ORF type:complete len:274 (-),score=15.90 TRINITY_DN6447_c0_g1_i6:384-1205(-)
MLQILSRNSGFLLERSYSLCLKDVAFLRHLACSERMRSCSINSIEADYRTKDNVITDLMKSYSIIRINQSSKISTRNFSTSSHIFRRHRDSDQKPVENEQPGKIKRQPPEIMPTPFPGWTTVFRFPYIVPMYIACRMKIYQTILTALAVPTAAGLTSTGVLSPSAFGFITGYSVIATGTLFIFGEIFRRTIGFIYLSPDKAEIIISHMNWWGKREDIRCLICDIVPPEDINEEVSDYFFRVKFFDSADFYLMSTKFGGIKCQKSFDHIFNKEL